MIKSISSTSRAIACAVLIFSAVASSSSQTNSGKTATASISGKVTLKNKGVAGIVVLAHNQNATGLDRSTYRATTDQTGSYRITNLPAGTYVITPIAPSLAVEDEMANNSVVVGEGETVEDINFRMVRGAVITGKVTDADGKPLIDEYIMVMAVDPAVIFEQYGGEIRTDDRGIYRAFGLQPGKYKVSVGQEYTVHSNARRSYRRTFHPAITDAEKATVIEVKEGGEARDIDIVVGRPLPTFNISGRIVDADTGKPLSNIKYGLHQTVDQNSSHRMVGRTFSNANGEFRLENILPGNYAVFIVPGESGVRGDSVSFEVVDRDVSDLLIKAEKASSLSGVVVFEGAEEKTPASHIPDLYINVWVEATTASFHTSNSVRLNPDGTFRISGLQKGLAHFEFASRTGAASKLALVRIERDGIAQPKGLTVQDGEQITGLRLVVKYLTGAIHGQVKVEGDDSLPTSRISVWLTRVDHNSSGSESQTWSSSPQLDARRRFVAEGLAAGTYEVNVAVFDPSRHETGKTFKQQVTVTDNAVSEVTVTIKTKP